VRVTAEGAKRVSMAALICTKAGHRSRLIYRIPLDRGPAKGRRKDTLEFNPFEGVCVAAYGLLDCRPRNGPDFVDCSNRMCRPARCYGEVGGCGDRRMSRVISLGAKTRNGGPQKPVPRLV
jgi:hypothetical protein